STSTCGSSVPGIGYRFSARALDMSWIFTPRYVVGASILLSIPLDTPIFATSMKKMIRHMTTSISGVTFTPPSLISGMECLRMSVLLSIKSAVGSRQWAGNAAGSFHCPLTTADCRLIHTYDCTDGGTGTGALRTAPGTGAGCGAAPGRTAAAD